MLTITSPIQEPNVIIVLMAWVKVKNLLTIHVKIPSISLAEARRKLKQWESLLNKFTSSKPIEDKLNNSLNKDDQYKAIDSYDATRELAYRNIAKTSTISIIKRWIETKGNKLAAGSPLLTKEVLSVTAMKGNTFVTELADADHIMIHYADKTKGIFTISPKDSKVKQVKEYGIAELGKVVYTPNMVDKDRSDLINAIVEKIESCGITIWPNLHAPW